MLLARCAAVYNSPWWWCVEREPNEQISAWQPLCYSRTLLSQALSNTPVYCGSLLIHGGFDGAWHGEWGRKDIFLGVLEKVCVYMCTYLNWVGLELIGWVEWNGIELKCGDTSKFSSNQSLGPILFPNLFRFVCLLQTTCLLPSQPISAPQRCTCLVWGCVYLCAVSCDGAWLGKLMRWIVGLKWIGWFEQNGKEWN